MAHLPFLLGVAWLNHTSGFGAFVLWALSITGPLVAPRVLQDVRQASLVHGFAYMCLGGVLVHVGQGPIQIEMHFYFFAMLAILAIFANPAVITVSAATVTVHHIVLWLLLPDSVFFYDAPFGVVLVHAAFVGFASAAAVYFARTYLDNVVALEAIIEERTAALNGRNEDMKLLLNSVDQGFFTLDRAARISIERSQAASSHPTDLPSSV
ncbi:MAG: hypothetical protein AAFV53_39125, partial [Myxococcota bacterium]